jgi:predicted acylesterase/phospholipase RssA
MYAGTAFAFVNKGGGTRARISQQFTKLFANQMGVTQAQFLDRVDLFAGASAGGLQSLAYAKGITPDELDPFLLVDSKRIFTTRQVIDLPFCDASADSFRPDFAFKIGLILINDPFYKSACAIGEGDSNWGSNILQSSLENLLGTTHSLLNLNKKVIIPSYEDDTNQIRYFSNIEGFPFIGGSEKLVDVARCTSAAPVYLPSYTLNGHRYIDGGVGDNCPVRAAYSGLKASFPNADRYVIISVGTGKEPNVIEGTPINDEQSSLMRLYNLFNTASYSAEQKDVMMMQYDALNIRENLFYYDFDLNFPDGFDSEFDQSTDPYFASLDALTLARYNEDNAAITDIIQRLEA